MLRRARVRTHIDDRRLFYGAIFPTDHGDVNVIHLYGGALSAWHRHQRQTDWFFCTRGRVKIGWIGEDWDGGWIILDERQPGPVPIVPRTWHGYQAFDGDATLVMWASEHYDPTDEERKSIADMGVAWDRVPH